MAGPSRGGLRRVKGLAAVILAAGKGERMKSALPKVMHLLGDRPLLHNPVERSLELGANPVCVVVGYGKEKVLEYLRRWTAVTWAEQKEQMGTAHAVLACAPSFSGFLGDVIILLGDVPLVRRETLEALLREHRRTRDRLTFITAVLENPAGYGRCVRGDQGRVLRIVEEKNATAEEKAIREINTGIYVVQAPWLWEKLPEIRKDPVKGEYYLTDLVAMAAAEGRVAALAAEDPGECLGVNTLEDLQLLRDLSSSPA